MPGMAEDAYGCDKHSYASRRAARRGRIGTSGDRLRVYLCPLCKNWHLTSSVGSSKGRKITQAIWRSQERRSPRAKDDG